MQISENVSAVSRRAFLTVAGGALGGLAAMRTVAKPRSTARGLVVTLSDAAKVGNEMLAAGGNAVDAVVAAALVAGVVNISKCGIGGYGGHAIIGLPNGKVTAIDFNTIAPAAAKAEMFSADERGNVKGDAHKHGWLAASVPGTLAGLDFTLKWFGSLPWKQVMQPAIRFAREGFPLYESCAFWRNPAHPDVPRDAASARLFSRNGKPIPRGETFCNPDLASMLEQLGDEGSAESFYRGKIAQKIAQAFQANGGLVTSEDMAFYQAREVEPLTMEWGDYTIATAPLTAGGLSVLQAIATLKALNWADQTQTPQTTHAWLEALRATWGDRLTLLGDPEFSDVPVQRLLSEEHAEESANRVRAAVAEKRPVPIETDGFSAGGTVHISGTDSRGMMVALTLTHGDSFGAQVTVDGLGLLLGHGMSRFDPVPGRPNSIAPGKRPLHNMCPTILLRDGRPVVAIGGTGGRRIPNALYQSLCGLIAQGRCLEDSMAARRLHTEGGLEIYAEPGVSETDLNYLKNIGYKIQGPLLASVYAVERDAVTDSGGGVLGVADGISREGATLRNPRPAVTRGR